MREKLNPVVAISTVVVLFALVAGVVGCSGKSQLQDTGSEKTQQQFNQSGKFYQPPPGIGAPGAQPGQGSAFKPPAH